MVDVDKAIDISINIAASIGIALCVVALLLLTARKYVDKATSTCLQCCRSCCCCCKDDKDLEDAERSPKKGSSRVRDLKREESFTEIQEKIESLQRYRSASFQIPCMIAEETIQPPMIFLSQHSRTNSVLSDTSLNDSWEPLSGSFPMIDDNGQVDIPSTFIHEYPQPVITQKTGPQSKRDSISQEVDESENTTQDAERPIRLATRKSGLFSLGTITFQLQYQDPQEHGLFLTLQSIQNIQYPRPEVEGVYVSIQLIPEREYRHISRQLYRNIKLNFNDQFLFKSSPGNREFGSRTILLTVIFVEKSSKQINYGEARLSLIGMEIFTQVPTNLQLEILPIPPHNEIGDAEVTLRYDKDQQELTVAVHSLRFPTAKVLEHATHVRIKAYLRTLQNRSSPSKKKTISAETPDSRMIVDFMDEMVFELPRSKFVNSGLKLRIQGKQKITRRTLSMGHVTIGDNSTASALHWEHVHNAPSNSWTMWHPIYSY